MTRRYTQDLDDEFFPLCANIAEWLGTDVMFLLKVMFAESGMIASEPNHAGSGCVGILQFDPNVLRGLGWFGGPDAFRMLSATEQLRFVKAYFARWRGQLPTLATVYCGVFMPVCVPEAANPNAVLSSPKDKIRGWAFAQNAKLDANGDGVISMWELEAAVQRNCVGPRWAEVVQRATGKEHPAPSISERIDLRTILGLQRALAALGFDPGPLDGIRGHLTELALRAFQTSAGIAADGMPGPVSRRALEQALAARNHS